MFKCNGGEVADNSVDLVCSDVPYLVTSRGNSGSMGGYVTNKLAMCGKIFENNSIKPSDYLPHFLVSKNFMIKLKNRK